MVKTSPKLLSIVYWLFSASIWIKLNYCINVFVVNKIQTSDKDKKETKNSTDIGGTARIGSRYLFIEDEHLSTKPSHNLLAQEFGHNLGLIEETKEVENLMYSPITGDNLNDK